MNQHKNKEKASTTLEAAIVMSTILIMLCAIFFAFQILYQHIVLEYAVSYGASRGTLMWEYEDYDFLEGTVEGKRSIYDSINVVLFNGSTKDRTDKIEAETRKIISDLTIVNAKNLEVEAVYKNTLAGSQITVTASQDLDIPFDAILTYLSDGDMKLKATSVSSIFDPDEYIRNIDYGVEIAKTIGEKIGPKMDKIKSRFKSGV